MENLNAEQVKKGLECLNNKIDRDCDTCQIFWRARKSPLTGNCRHLILDAALALINKQETEYNELYELCESYRKESESLRAENEMLLNIKKLNLDKVIADTVRKMQERLNKRFGRDKNRVHTDYNVHRYIDQIAKEMLEGK